MESWKASWEIIDEQVTCRTCGTRQDVRDAQRPFEHREGCAAAIQAEQMPWGAIEAGATAKWIGAANVSYQGAI